MQKILTIPSAAKYLGASVSTMASFVSYGHIAVEIDPQSKRVIGVTPEAILECALRIQRKRNGGLQKRCASVLPPEIVETFLRRDGLLPETSLEDDSERSEETQEHPQGWPDALETQDPPEKSEKTRQAITWIKASLKPCHSSSRQYSAYVLKHVMQNDIGLYTTWQEFDEALRLAGFKPVKGKPTYMSGTPEYQVDFLFENPNFSG